MPRTRRETTYSGWSGVKLRYISLIGPDEARDLIEDRIVLFHAAADEALAMALEQGPSYEHDYENALGQTVRVRFEGVVELVELFDAPGDGAEVWWDFWNPTDGEGDDPVVPSTVLLRARNTPR